MYPEPSGFDCLPKSTQMHWREWVRQVPVFGFNSSRYDLNLIKKYFVKPLSDLDTVKVAKKENSYMFLMTPRFKFLDIKNYLAPGLSYDRWCKAYGCKLEKLVFPYEWLDSYEKLDHVGPVSFEAFYSSLNSASTISED